MGKPHTIRDVVERGMCIGCGGCSVATEGRIPVRFTTIGMRQADLATVSEADVRLGDVVCPLSDNARNEDELGAPTAWGRALPHDHRVGHHSLIAAGRRTNESALMLSSSGGLTSWVVEKLLDAGDVDGVVHAGEQSSGDDLFSFAVSYSQREADGRRKSKYYPVAFNEVLDAIKGDGRKYALIGVPCLIKSARLLAENDRVLADQIAYYIGLVCGHLKTRFFAESLGWQLGVPPEDLGTVDFRLKNSERVASRYDMSATSRRDPSATFRGEVASLVGGNWGHAVFQPEGCNFCDDIFAETADVVFGDAWLPEYSRDWRGMNVLVSRNERIDVLLREGAASGEIVLEELDVARAAMSQAGNFRHRRDGLAVRAHDDIRAGLSVPTKRVAAGVSHVSRRRRRVIRQRRKISAISFELFRNAKQDGNLASYISAITPELRKHDRISRGGAGALVRRLRHHVGKLLSRLGLR